MSETCQQKQGPKGPFLIVMEVNMTLASAWGLVKLLFGLWALSLLIGGLIETINRKQM